MQEYSIKHAVNITTLKANLRVGTRDASSDVLSMLDDMRLARNDFVVLKFGVISPPLQSVTPPQCPPPAEVKHAIARSNALSVLEDGAHALQVR